MKYILVTGGVISGVGKGVIASSFGTLLKSYGLAVTPIKIDPYINIDAGTFSPYEHGEVFVLDDGAEVDLDLGNYERFLDVTLHRDNNITTGKIYQEVIQREREGAYLGKTVQVVPHVTDAIQAWVQRVATTPVESGMPQVCIIELGGTIGDIESMQFVEAFRQFQFKGAKEDFCLVHVSLVPTPSSTGEAKTKPTQSSVRELRGFGLSPDFIVCRSEKQVNAEVKDKISNFCQVKLERVLCIPDLTSIYHVPLLLQEYNLVQMLNERMNLNIQIHDKLEPLRQWRVLAHSVETVRDEVKIALVGKYTKFHDCYASVLKALQHAALSVGYKLCTTFIESDALEESMRQQNPQMYHRQWKLLCQSDGILVPGGFGSRGFEGKISACRWARENNKPYLGICLGLQAAVVEFARNVAGLAGANSEEVEKNAAHLLVVDMPDHHTGQMGGTMRLGRHETMLVQPCKIRALYSGADVIAERHRHRYEVNTAYKSSLEEKGLQFVGVDRTYKRMEIIELKNHAYFVATQFHPEYLSRPLKPSPPFLGLILAAVGKLDAHLAQSPTRQQSNVLTNRLATLAIEDRNDSSSMQSGSSSESEFSEVSR